MSEAGPKVSTSQGCLLGSYLTTRLGKRFSAFQGIPYAKPPKGDLRFQPPEPPESWDSVRQAQSEGHICLQKDSMSQAVAGQEDCLYLNVFTPQIDYQHDHKKEYSVMVWIHGGGYSTGSGSQDLYGPTYLLDKDVILVTLNYRVGVFGFLNLGIDEASGNCGLKDQVAALRWVQKNISNFGGNRNCVTIFGESAGGASIHYLLMSPLAKGLFHKAIIQSGSAFSNWSYQTREESIEIGKMFADLVGCKQVNETLILACLKNKSAIELVEAEIMLRKKINKPFSAFTPTVEMAKNPQAFITNEPRKIMEHGEINHVPIIIGITSHEGILNYAFLENLGSTVDEQLHNNMTRYLPKDLQQIYDVKKLGKSVNEFYEKLYKNDLIERYIHFSGDVDFNVGVDYVARKIASYRKCPVFYYEFTYDGHLGLVKKLFGIERRGACHADELGYLFSRTMLSDELRDASEPDINILEKITEIWSTFAKSAVGNPTSLGVVWQAIKAPLHGPNHADTNYLEIGEKIIMKKENLNEKRYKFWQQLYDVKKNSKL